MITADMRGKGRSRRPDGGRELLPVSARQARLGRQASLSAKTKSADLQIARAFSATCRNGGRQSADLTRRRHWALRAACALAPIPG
jgi:hypothetical protein